VSGNPHLLIPSSESDRLALGEPAIGTDPAKGTAAVPAARTAPVAEEESSSSRSCCTVDRALYWLRWAAWTGFVRLVITEDDLFCTLEEATREAAAFGSSSAAINHTGHVHFHRPGPTGQNMAQPLLGDEQP
jgi:hypothetical protein